MGFVLQMFQVSLIIFIKLTPKQRHQELGVRDDLSLIPDVGVVVKRLKVVEGTWILIQKLPQE